MTLEEIMTRNPVTIGPLTTAAAAARQMQRSCLGGLPVCSENGKLVGYLTDRDLTLRCIAAEQSGDTPVSRLMTKRVVSVGPDWEINSARRLMLDEDIHRLPVTVAGKLVGMVTLSDIAAETEKSLGQKRL